MNDSLTYRGNVKIKLIIAGKTIDITGHNAGTKYLKQSLCWFLSKNYSLQLKNGAVENLSLNNSWLPNYLDLLYRAPNSANFVSFLNNRQPLTSPSYLDEDASIGVSMVDDGNDPTPYYPPSVTYTGMINYSNLVQTISASDTGEFLLALYSGGDVANAKALAYMPVNAKELSKLSPGTNAMVEWKMYFTDGD